MYLGPFFPAEYQSNDALNHYYWNNKRQMNIIHTSGLYVLPNQASELSSSFSMSLRNFIKDCINKDHTLLKTYWGKTLQQCCSTWQALWRTQKHSIHEEQYSSCTSLAVEHALCYRNAKMALGNLGSFEHWKHQQLKTYWATTNLLKWVHFL